MVSALYPCLLTRTETSFGSDDAGFHWSRPPAPRIPLLHLNESKPKNWNWEDVQETAGGFIIMHDKLLVFASGRYVPTGPSPGGGGALQFDSTGLATLRRDGLASLDAVGGATSVTTRPVTWAPGLRFLFVNFKGIGLRVGVRNSAGQEIRPFTMENSVLISNDTTRTQVHWKGEDADGLAAIAGQPVQFVFDFGAAGHSSSLFSFWVAETTCGESRGYTAGGGPGLNGDVDSWGSCPGEPALKSDDGEGPPAQHFSTRPVEVAEGEPVIKC